MGVRNLGFVEEHVPRHLLGLLFFGAKQSMTINVVCWHMK